LGVLEFAGGGFQSVDEPVDLLVTFKQEWARLRMPREDAERVIAQWTAARLGGIDYPKTADKAKHFAIALDQVVCLEIKPAIR
jgi:hypothetical protein